MCLSFREADVKAEHFERKVQQLEALLAEEEKKGEELKAKNQGLQAQLDEFHAQLEEIWPVCFVLPSLHGPHYLSYNQ